MSFTETITLIKVECICGFPFAIPQSLYDSAHKTKRSIYCPSCMAGFVYTDTLEKENETLRLKLQDRDNCLAEERAKTRQLETRIQRGICTSRRAGEGFLREHPGRCDAARLTIRLRRQICSA